MVNVNDEFASKYLKSADLRGQVITVKIDRVVVEEIGKDKERKLVMYFVGKSRGCVLNKTNALTVGEAFGGNTDEWADQTVELFSMKVEYNGRMVDGLRMRVPQKQAARIAPNARARSENPAPALATAEELDDEIPF